MKGPPTTTTTTRVKYIQREVPELFVCVCVRVSHATNGYTLDSKEDDDDDSGIDDDDIDKWRGIVINAFSLLGSKRGFYIGGALKRNLVSVLDVLG